MLQLHQCPNYGITLLYTVAFTNLNIIKKPYTCRVGLLGGQINLKESNFILFILI
nr:MAG TPA: hypothetical protein [Caudoviricetes sp.]